MRQTLERWLGPAAAERRPAGARADQFRRRGAGANLSSDQQRGPAVAPEARIVAHRESLGPLLHSLHVLQWVAFGLVLLLSGAAAAAVVLAARGALDTHRFTIEVMHGIGATDVQVTHLFQRKIAIDALAGSLAGARCRGARPAAARQLARLSPVSSPAARRCGALDLLMLALLPFALTALATWVARTAVLAALREAL